jgi:hypothetical protein
MLFRALLLLCAVAACTTSGESVAAPGTAYNVYIAFTPVAPGATGFSAQLDGRTYDSAGATTVNLTSGTHQMTGTYRGSGFGVGFATTDAAGGVKSGSVRTLAGPSPRTSACSITYASADTPDDQHGFQFEFTVDAKSAGLCASPVP